MEGEAIFERRTLEKRASREADNLAVESGQKNAAELAAESEAFARARARMADRDLAAELRIEMPRTNRLASEPRPLSLADARRELAPS